MGPPRGLIIITLLPLAIGQYSFNQQATPYSPYNGNPQQSQQSWVNPNQPQQGQQNQYQGGGFNQNQYGNQGAVYPSTSVQEKPKSGTPMRFCSVGFEEQQMCESMVRDLSKAGIRSNARNKRQLSSRTKFYFECVKAVDK